MISSTRFTRLGAELLLGALLLCCGGLGVVLYWQEVPGWAWAAASVTGAAGGAAGVWLWRKGGLSLVTTAVMLLGCVLSAAVAIPLAERVLPQPERALRPDLVRELRVTATGERTAGAGTEVWLVGLFRPDGSRVPWSEVQMDSSWEPRGDRFVSYQHQPATMRLRGAGLAGTRLVFAEHPWSGAAVVSWDGTDTRLDLFSPVAAERTMILAVHPRGGILAALYLPALAAAAALPWLVMLAIGLALPQPWRGRLSLPVFVLPVFFIAVAASPGIYTLDSQYQLSQATSGTYGDWNPSLMAGVWSLLIGITGSPSALFYLHLGVLGAALVLWALAFRRACMPASAVVLFLLACSPQMLNFAGVLWKDVGMTVALMAAFGAVALARTAGRGHAVALLLVFILGGYAQGVRVNSLPALLPLVFLAAWPLAGWSGWWRLAQATALSAVLMVAILGGNWFLSYQTLDTARQHPEQYIQLFDIAGIAVRTNEDLFPSRFKTQDFSMDAVRSAYQAYSGNYLFWPMSKDAKPALRFAEPLETLRPADPASVADLRRAWWTALRQHPAAYIAHRLSVFGSLLRVGDHGEYGGYLEFAGQRAEVAAKRLDVGTRLPGSAGTEQILMDMLRWTAERTPLFFGWFWLLVQLFVLASSLVLRRAPLSGVSLALALSGLFYMAPYFLAAPASDFRYLYWSVISANLGVAILAGQVCRLALARMQLHWREQTPSYSATP